MTKINRFSDIKRNTFEDVEKWYKIGQLVDMEITIQDAVPMTGKFGGYLVVKFSTGNEVDAPICGVCIGAKVVMERINTAKENGLLPIVGTIVKPADWYDIV